MAVIIMLISMLFEFFVPIIIFVVIFKVLARAGKTSGTNKYDNYNSGKHNIYKSQVYSVKTYDDDEYETPNVTGKLSDYCKPSPMLNDSGLSANEDLRKSQDARKAYLKEKFGNKLEEKKKEEKVEQVEIKPDLYNSLEIEQATDPIVQTDINLGVKTDSDLDTRPDIDLEAKTNIDMDSKIDTSFDSILDSTLNSSFDYGFGGAFEPKFDSGFGSTLEQKDDDVFKYKEESFVDSLLKEYGVETKTYEWEKKADE